MRATIVILCVALLGVARADEKATAEKYFRAGAKAYAAQNFEAAIANFEEAYRALPVPEIAFSAAQAYRRQYRVDARPEYVKRSVELYRIYLDKVKTGGRVGDAADSLGEMQRELDRLGAAGIKAEMRIVERTRLGVTIAVDDKTSDKAALREIGDAVGDALPGVTATLDGKPLEPFALVDVDPGEHVVAVSAPGYEPIEQKHRAVAGASELIDIALRARPARVGLKTEPDTRVIVDGRPSAMPTGVLELVAGKHVITLLHDGRKPIAKEIVVERGATTTIVAPLVKTTQRRAVPWIYLGAGALALGATTGAIVALVANGDASDLHAKILVGNRAASDADTYDRLVKRRDRAATATYVLGGAAVLAAVIGTGLYLFDAPSAEGVTVTPVASPDGAAVVVGGRF